MKKFKALLNTFFNMSLVLVTGFFTSAICHVAHADTPSQVPIFISSPVKPILMLNLSNDHQLYFKLYDDYSDISTAAGASGIDGAPDTTYKNSFDYYGYFASDICYTYSDTNKVFSPATLMAGTRTCSNQWSGNFLNWASMTRIDAIRKILYGGKRSTDEVDNTVLERAYLPNDAHSFAKFYNGSDLASLVPTAVYDASGITMCNTTYDAAGNNSQSVTSPPLIRAAKGNYALWANNERWQCLWSDERDASNGNIAAASGLNSAASNPRKNDIKDSSGVVTTAGVKAGVGDYVVRVKTCVTGITSADEGCSIYPNNSYKPRGLLQEYGEKDLIHFGLMMGSYTKNKSGGVLRKNAGSLTDEINKNTGKFEIPSDDFNIINSIDLLRVYGYHHKLGGGDDNGTYHSGTDSDNCKWAKNSFNNGDCTNWGNPQAEIYLESLRYLSGATAATPAFYDASKLDSSKITNLKTVSTWKDPIYSTQASPVNTSTGLQVGTNACAPLNVLVFNASVTSYDSDELGTSTDIGLSNTQRKEKTNDVARAEGIMGTSAKSFFVGRNGTVAAGAAGYEMCTAKTIGDFSAALGLCPEAPRLEGGFQIAGLAYHARTTGVKANRSKVKTFGVTMSPAVPNLSISITTTPPNPATGAPAIDKPFKILPACRNNTIGGNCAIVDFKIVSQTPTGGKLYVSWEDSEQGGDFDQDMWGTIEYAIAGSAVSVTTRVYGQSTGDSMGFGYVVSGTSNDGFHVHSGINRFIESAGSYCANATSCTCRAVGDGNTGPCTGTLNDTTAKTFALGDSNSQDSLKDPLFYAAKWGGFSKDLPETEPEKQQAIDAIASVKIPDSYFYATDPRRLQASLRAVLDGVSKTVASSATAAANSTQLDTGTFFYQAIFNSTDWSSQLIAYKFDKSTGKVDKITPAWNTHNTLQRGSRNIYTYGSGSLQSAQKLTADNLGSAPTALKNQLRLSSETNDVNALKRFNWLLGLERDETSQVNGTLRAREHVLGDVVNSDPAFSGGNSLKYDFLPAAYGSASYLAYVNGTKKTGQSAIFVGANDGMMHAFNAETGAEIFAYVPRGVYSKLAALSKPDYKHEFNVDGPVYAGDYYTGSAWRTVVVGSLGAGGRGIYALDVTDTLSSGTAPKVMFDVSADDGVTPYRDDLGYIMSRPLLAPTKNGGWTVFFGNGTNSVNGAAKLMAINIQNPTKYIAIDTGAKDGATTNNGLSGPALLPDGQGVIIDAYAGDILGNMWRFNLSNTSLSSWSIPYASGGSPSPLIKVTDATGKAQPITATPTLGMNALKTYTDNGKEKDSVMVYFGTGKFNETTDKSSTGVQSFYGIADSGAAIVAGSNRSGLHKKVIDTGASNSSQRVVNFDATPVATGVPAVDWSVFKGWYLDFSTASGERVITKPLLLFDRLIFGTFIPSNYQCDFGGSGWLMELTGVGDKHIGYSLLQNKANHILDSVIYGALIPIFDPDSNTINIMGSDLAGGIFETKPPAPPGIFGRMSWRQLK